MTARPFILCFLWCAMTAIFSACHQGKIKTYSNCNPAGDSSSIRLSFGDTLHFSLDSLMILNITTPVSYEENTRTFYAFDEYNKRLLVYPLRQRAMINPDTIYQLSTKQKITWFKVFSPDSVVLYGYGTGHLYYYSLRNNTVVKELDFGNTGAAARPYATAGSPVYFNDSVITGFGYLMGEIPDEKPAGRTICSAIHLPGGHASYHVPYSDIYREYNWGGAHLRTVYATQQGTGTYILSLPADHNVQVIDSNWQIKNVYAGSRKKVCITSMDLSKHNKKMFETDVALDYYFSTPSYRNIIHDKYHDRFYRILEWPPVNAKLGKKSWLIAFDKDFKYLGEAPLPESLALDNFFLTSDGLYILDTNNKDQNTARYVQCKVEI